MLRHIRDRLEKHQHVEDSARSYNLLLEKMKDSSRDEQISEEISVFLRLWMKEVGEGDSIEEAEKDQVRSNYRDILSQYVNRCIESWESTNLYREIFKINDQEKFVEARISRMEEMVETIANKNDLRLHFLRNMFLFLLDYLSFTPESRTNKKQPHIDEFANPAYYRNICDPVTKKNGFETLRRWALKNYVDLNETVAYNSPSLISAYLSNLTHGDREFSQSVMKEFFKMTEMLSIPSCQILVSMLMEEFKGASEDEGKRVILAVIREVVEARKVFEVMPASFSYFIPVENHYSKEIKIEVLQLMGFVVRSVKQDYFHGGDERTMSLRYNICEFFFSLAETLAYTHGRQSSTSLGSQGRNSSKKIEETGGEDIVFKYQFCNAIISVMKCVQEKYEYCLMVGFAEKINEQIRFLDLKASQSKVVLYFTLYLIHEIKYLINKKEKVPSAIAKINLKITPSSNPKDTRK